MCGKGEGEYERIGLAERESDWLVGWLGGEKKRERELVCIWTRTLAFSDRKSAWNGMQGESEPKSLFFPTADREAKKSGKKFILK